MIVLFYYVLIIFFLVYKMLQVSGLLQRSMRRVVSVCPIAVYFLVKKCEIEKLWISPCVWIFENSMKENLALLKHFFYLSKVDATKIQTTVCFSTNLLSYFVALTFSFVVAFIARSDF